MKNTDFTSVFFFASFCGASKPTAWLASESNERSHVFAHS